MYDEPSTYELIDKKSVMDSDGFYTDYCLYYDILNDRYVTVFGDSDLYRPEDGYFDAEFDSEEEALEWFENYSGFTEDEPDTIRYTVTGYFGSNYSGIAEDYQSDDWSEIETYAHDMLNNGLYVEIIDEYTGKNALLDPDSYLDGFEGEFPVKPWDLDEHWS